jgi:hypothetical protein
MYDTNLDLPFEIGFNLNTFAFILNIGIPLLYFANFILMVYKLNKMEKEAPLYNFIKSMVFFFFFYGLGGLFFVWYDFFYMDFKSPNPILITWGVEVVPEMLSIHLWKIGNLLQLIGLLSMIIQLRKRIFKEKLYMWLPIIWEVIGIGSLIFIGLIPLPIRSEDLYLWADILFLFTFIWSITLPLTYAYIAKISAGHVRKYGSVLFASFIVYGIAWGFRSRLIHHVAIVAFSGIPNSIITFEFVWWFRSMMMLFSLGLVLFAYQRLLKDI